MREKSINFLDTTPSGASRTWALMNKGIESAATSYNATTQSRHFIADANATQDVTGFAKQLDVTQFAYEGDSTFTYIDNLFFNDAKGADADTNLLQVFLYKAPVGGAYPAKQQPVTIQLDSHGGDGGDQLQLGYNVLFKGDPIKGTVVLTDGVPVFTADGEEEGD